MVMTFSKVTEFSPTSEETTAVIRDFRQHLSSRKSSTARPPDLCKISFLLQKMRHKPETFLSVFGSLRLVLRNVDLFNISMRCQAE